MQYWHSRFLFERSLALIYLVAFAVAANQFVPLSGEHGLLPISDVVQFASFRESPSLFFLSPTDTAFRVAAWTGIALSLLALSAWPQRRGTIAAAVVWGALWLLYLSFVNAGQTFYAFGWETLLLEFGFLAIFLGGSTSTPSPWLGWMYRWVLFRMMFGAGLIKLRGDPCWRDLTCLNYYFETQPIPNPLSWYFHWLPEIVHKMGVAINFFVELIVPFGLFAPQPIAGIAALLTIGFQGVLIVSGNLAWFNWLTLILCIPALDTRFLSWLPVRPPALQRQHVMHRGALYALAIAIGLLSIAPARNMLSSSQLMNSSFEPSTW